MFSTEQSDFEFNWEDMNRKVLHIMVSKDSSGEEETVVVVGWEYWEDVTDNYREMSYRELGNLASEMGIVVEIIE